MRWHRERLSVVALSAIATFCLTLALPRTARALPGTGPYWAPVAGGGGSGTWTTSGSTWALTSGTIGTRTQSTTATLIFGNNAGTVTVGGTVSAAAGLQLSTSGYLFTGGTISLTGVSSGSNSIIVDTSITGTINSIMSGSNGMTKAGAGVLTLSGNNTYSGGTTITAGTLVVGNASALGSGNALAVNAGTLDLNGQAMTLGALSGSSSGIITTGTTGSITLTSSSAANSTYAGSISNGAGTIAFTKQGAGTLTLTGSNGYSGVTNINGGVLALGNTNALAGGGTISFGGGTLQYSGSNTADYSARIVNSGSAIAIDTNGQNVTFATGLAASNTGGLTKSGLGTLTLSGSNAYSGPTTVTGGVLAYGGSNVLAASSAVTVAGGGLNLGSYDNTVASVTITSGSLSGSGKLTAATYALGGGTVAANLGGGTMTVSGNSNLNGTADATAVSLNAGTLTLGSAGRFTSDQVALTGSSGASITLGGSETVGSLAGAFNVSLGSATLTTGNDNSSTTYSGILSGSGGLTKAGGGTFIMSGSNTYTGATAVNGGRLLVNGQLGHTAVGVNAFGLLGGNGTILGDVTVQASGTLSPGNSPGVVTVGSLALLAGSHTVMEITGTSSSLYDQVVGIGGGGLTYGGSLDLVMSGSYADQTTFHLFSNFLARNGDFTAVELNATGEYAGLTFSDAGGVWTSTWTAHHQRLVFTSGTGDLVVVPEPSTYAMMLAGLACGGWHMIRRRRAPRASMAGTSTCRRLKQQPFQRLLCSGVCVIGALPACEAAETLTAPFVVPLQQFTIGTERRLGIAASFAGATLSPVPEYLFDTGSSPLVSAYQSGAPWWGAFTTIDPSPAGSPISYGSGVTLDYTLVATAVTLTGGGSATLTTGTSFQVAQAYQREVEGVPDVNWLANSPPNGDSPPDQNTFYGTFGADLQAPGNGMFGIVNQFTMAPGMSSGFVVDATGTQATLTIGLDGATRGLFVEQFPINPGTGGGYSQNVVNASFQFSKAGSAFPGGSDIPTLFDTGTPGPAVITLGSALSIDASLIVPGGPGQVLAPGVELCFSLGGVQWRAVSDVGNEIVVESGTGAGSVVLGRPFFDSYKVMYDVQDGMIGFLAAASVPEIDAAGMGSAMAIVAGAYGLLERRRTKG